MLQSATLAKLGVELSVADGQFSTRMRGAENRFRQSVRGMEGEARKLDGAMSRLGGVFANFGKGLLAGAAAGVTIGALQNLARNALQAADALDKMALSADINVERLQSLRFAFQQTGVGADEGARGVAVFAQRLGEFRSSGAGPAAEALKRLRLDAAVLTGELPNTEAALDAVFRQLSKVEDAGQQSALAAQLFGREVGTRMVRALKDGADGVADLEQQARDLGLVLDREMIDKAVEISDRWAAMTSAMGTRFQSFALDVISTASRVYDALRNMIPEMGAPTSGDLRGMSRGDLEARLERAQERARLAGDPDSARGQMASREIATIKAEIARLDQMAASRAAAQDFGAVDLSARASSGGGASRASSRSDRDAFGEAAARYREAMWAIRDEAEVLPQGEEAMKAFQREAKVTALTLDLLRVAQRDGTAATAEQVAEINQLADAYDDALQRLDQAQVAIRAKAQAERDAAAAAQEHARTVEQVGNAIAGAITQARTFEDALRNVAVQLLNMAGQGLLGAGPLGGALGSIIPNLFGGGSTTGTPLTVATARLPAFANGTNFAPGGMAIVGERGRELVNLPRGSQVIPNRQTEAMLGGGSGGSIRVYLGEGLRAEILDEAARKSVQIVDGATRGPGFASRVAAASRGAEKSRLR